MTDFVSKSQEKRVFTQQQPKFGSPLWSLISQVGSKTTTLAIAEKHLRDYVNELPEEEKAEFRADSRKNAEHLRQVAEAFSQLLTVIGAGQ